MISPAIGGWYDWEDALVTCEGLSYAGYTDWRVPNVRELLSIMDFEPSSGARLNSVAFPNTVIDDYYWTSTTYMPDTATVWIIHFGVNAPSNGNKTSDYLVLRCVRGGP